MKTALTYTVNSGDSISNLAMALSGAAGVTVEEVTAANPDINPNALQIGSVLSIPSQGERLNYTVLHGDTLSGICAGLAECTNMTAAAIETSNPAVSPNAIFPGQQLKIPQTHGAAAPMPVTDAEYRGYWAWTYSQSAVPANATMSMAFSGWADVQTALQDSAPKLAHLVGTKFLCVGGGNQSGAFTSANLTALTAAIQAGECVGYEGIAYDVEEGYSGLESLFTASFATAKSKGFKVLVTVSHSAPYGITDSAALMKSFFADANIDFLSPQLYTSGKETSNDYSTSHGVSWSDYAACKAKIVPSLVNASMYDAAKDYFAGQGVSIRGFVQWAQS
ncbi:LysM peptidoglycan-binding domain-containing protein [Shewanella sp. AS16]|uniref:LysM peptidoglycan-binding domain-containing protein n=1 Tax=Shewanella sp. AS16 TaxID=2907625 RepID=UPI001F1D8E5C|nr:LysM peptidoglycan-binding domain-containing protein [Shewanella sp. AS16]MCE9687148.1 LysM peptidoglycan-binding domain-containing protein [Shewanella sp. AS16]